MISFKAVRLQITTFSNDPCRIPPAPRRKSPKYSPNLGYIGALQRFNMVLRYHGSGFRNPPNCIVPTAGTNRKAPCGPQQPATLDTPLPPALRTIAYKGNTITITTQPDKRLTMKASQSKELLGTKARSNQSQVPSRQADLQNNKPQHTLHPQTLAPSAPGSRTTARNHRAAHSSLHGRSSLVVVVAASPGDDAADVSLLYCVYYLVVGVMLRAVQLQAYGT